MISKYISDFNLILIVKDFKLLAIFQHLRLLLQLPLEQRVAHHTDPDVDGLNVVLHIGDGLLNVDQGSVVTELLASVVDLP